jgi:hypothetical protein
MFGNKSMPARIYSYKCRPPVQGFELVGDQMWKAHRYKNTLIEIERRRREAVDAAVREHAPRVADVEARLAEAETATDAAEAAIKARSKESRSRTAATPVEKAELARLRAARRDLRRERKEARAEAFGGNKSLKTALGDIDDVAKGEAKAARKGCGVYWGTYLLVEQSLSGVKTGAPPKFRRWDGSGAVAVQTQGGMSWEDATACSDSRLRVEVLPASGAADPDSNRSRNKPMAVAWLRVGSDGRTPVWAKVPFRLHRTPPADARIKWAYLHREVIGGGVCWEVQFVVGRESWDRDDWGEGGAVGVDVNWRSIPDGLRVAYAVGDDGAERTLVLPRGWVDEWGKVESLQAIRDRNFNEARDALAGWLKVTGAPEWFRERSAFLPQWRSSERLAAMVRNWREHRFDGDGDIFSAMEAWRKQDRHLHDWQDHQHRKIVRRRDDLYRKFAAELSRRYRAAVIEGTDWKAMRAVPKPDEEADYAARVYARIASPGRFSELIRERFAVTHYADPAFTTKRCNGCGTVDEFDAAALVEHTCSGCGVTWDQDRNAALNLLAGEGAGAPA